MKGHLHPVTIITDQIIKYFEPLGFEVVTGPEIETEEYNFDKLNVPSDHPSRDMQDTFYLEDGRLLRTHTSAMQVRAMETRKPPVRLLIPGRSFRHEATDNTHETLFNHIEGLVIDKKVSFSNLIGTLKGLMRHLFSNDVEIDIRPSYFPFVEPGLEIHIKKDGKWLEILGAGMVHPKVLKNMGLDPKQYQGFAFGMSAERPAMIKYGGNDIRLMLSGDYRYLGQF